MQVYIQLLLLSKREFCLKIILPSQYIYKVQGTLISNNLVQPPHFSAHLCWLDGPPKVIPEIWILFPFLPLTPLVSWEWKYLSGISLDLIHVGNFDVVERQNMNLRYFKHFSCRLPFVNLWIFTLTSVKVGYRQKVLRFS